MFLLTQRIRSVYWNCLWLSAAYWVCLRYCFWTCLQGIQAVCSSRPTWSSRWRSIRGSVLSASRVVYVVHLITMWVLNTKWFIHVMKCWYFPLILLSFSIISASYCTYSVCSSAVWWERIQINYNYRAITLLWCLLFSVLSLLYWRWSLMWITWKRHWVA